MINSSLCIFLLIALPTIYAQDQPGCNDPIFMRKAIFYSPSIIGQDPHVNKIDIYTGFFQDTHRRDLGLIKQLGAEYVVVGENWAADGTSVHQGFLDLLNKLDLKLIVTYAIPMRDEEVTNPFQPSKNTLRDKAKDAFLLLLKEFGPTTNYNATLFGFSIPMPDLQRMSTKDLSDYYFLIHELTTLMREREITKYHKMIAGFPIDPREGSTPPPSVIDYAGIGVNYWSVEVYGADLTKSIASYQAAWGDDQTPQCYTVMLKIDSYDAAARGMNESQQATNMTATIASVLTASPLPNMAVVMEFSDEWWRSDLSQVGFASEGCPNSNAYAHTPCGIVTYLNDILSLEYMGLFQIQDQPFHFCVIAKEAVTVVQSAWGNGKNGTILPGQVFCAQLPQIIPWYVYPALAGLSLIVFVLLLVLPPPKPPKMTSDRPPKL